MVVSKKKQARSLTNKLLTAALAVTLVMPAYPASKVLAADAALVSDPFSSYPPGPLTIGSGNAWTKEGTAPGINVAQDTVTGQAYADIRHDAAGSSYLGQRFAAQNGGLVFEFDVKLPGSKGATLWMMDGKVNATNAAVLRYQLEGGVIKSASGANQMKADPTHWYRFKIIFNTPQRKYTTTITDLTTGSTVTWQEAFYSDRSRISSFGFFVTQGGGQIQLDNVKVTAMDLALNSLSVGSGDFVPTLTPAFNPAVDQYTADVPYNVEALTVTPSASYPEGVQVKVGGAAVASGSSAQAPISGDSTTIPVTVASSVYSDIFRTYSLQVNRLPKAPQLQFVSSMNRDASADIGWEETVDPAYREARIYRRNADQSLTLVDTVPKGKYISSIKGLSNGTTYTFVVKGAYQYAGEAVTESAGVEVTAAPVSLPARQMETLDRGLVAVKTASGVYVGWRLLGTDPAGTAFNLYRDGVKITSAPITGSTNFVDAAGTPASVYSVGTIVNGVEKKTSETAKVWDANYLDVPLNKPPGGVNPAGEAYEYRANDAMVGDLDGDGQYEIVLKWDPTNSKDNSQGGYTGNTYVDAYKLDGTFLWRIDLGHNIRSGAHYIHPMVYDLDGDGRAEITMRTADGTKDGAGVVIGDANADYRNSGGYVLDGPEYFTVFEGATGRALASDAYDPPRGTVTDWGDNYGNRVDRFGAAVAYLDGERPSVVLQRGYYTRMFFAAYNWRDGKLSKVWTFDSRTPGNEAYAGQGNHQLSVADVDADGRDEIFTGAAAIDDNGMGLWNSRLGHGDAMHLGDLDPGRLGLELYAVQEDTGAKYSSDMKDARTGRVLWGQPQIGLDVGRGLTADLDPRYPGEEAWSIGGAWNSPTGAMFNAQGEQISSAIPSTNFAIWWDGDLGRELLDHAWQGDTNRVGIPKIDKWNVQTGQMDNLETFGGTYSNNDTKGNPSLQGDLLGDWREEVVVRTEDSSALRIYTTTALTDSRIYTLMHDPVYRLGMAWQNTGYNQPPHTSFYLGTGMSTPQAPKIRTNAVSVSGITVTAPSAEVTAGQRLQLSAAVAPAAATNQQLNWTVSAEDGSTTALASIDANGLLKAAAVGTVKVTATAADGSGVSGSLLVRIQPVVTVGSGSVTLRAATDSKGTAAGVVTATDAQQALQTAAGKVLQVQLIPSSVPQQVKVSLPAQVLRSAADKRKLDTVQVRLDLATFTLNRELIREITGSKSSTIGLSVRKVDPSTLSSKDRLKAGTNPVYDFSLTVDGKPEDDLDGDLTIAVPYTLKPGEDPKRISIYYLDEDGDLEVERAKYNAQTGQAEFAPEEI